jgi:ketosteroid isomerase-like protein
MEGMMLRPVILLVSLACITFTFANQDKFFISNPPAIEKAVLEANAKMIQAAENLDAEGFFDWILDSVKGPVIQDGKLLLSRQEALEAVKRGFQGVARVKYQLDRTYVSAISPEVALLTAEGTSTATLEDGRTFSAPFALSEVFVLREGKWKVLHAHQSVPNSR